MSTLDTLFTSKPGDLFHTAKIEIVEMLINEKNWICRIGNRQWDGKADSLEHAKRLALKCMADKFRAPTMLLMKLKNEGVL